MKVRSGFNSMFFCLFLAHSVFFPLRAQQDSSADKPLKILSTVGAYTASVKDDPEKRMIELKTVIPQLIYDLRYATVNNFTGKRMYPSKTRHTFLRRTPAMALVEVQKELDAQGLRIKAFDVYRPYSVSIKFWELVHDERYVADPAKGSLHNRGLAIDMTLVNAASGKELEMGTGFDDFTEKAHPDFTGISPTALTNRKLLRSIMEKHGFVQFPTEWWHYSWPDDRHYETLDIDNETLYSALAVKKVAR